MCIAMIMLYIPISLHTSMPRSVFKLNLLSNSTRNCPKWVCIEISRSFWDFLISCHYHCIMAKNHFQLNSLVNPRGMLIWLKMGFHRNFSAYLTFWDISVSWWYPSRKSRVMVIQPTMGFYRHFPHFPTIDFQSPKIFYVPTRKW